MAKALRMAAAGLAGCLAAGALAEAPTVRDVVVRQRWPWSRLVDISYVLDCEDTQRVDVAVAGYSGATPLDLPLRSLSGERYGVSRGEHRIVWDPVQTAYTNAPLTRFNVTVTSTPVPLYMIVDLTNAAGASAQVEYIYPGDSRLETYGRWTNVWFGVTNSAVYKTDKLVLRRVPPGAFTMGEEDKPTLTRAVTLTRPCYAGVFELTEVQWYRIMGTEPSAQAVPKVSVPYERIRGAAGAVPPVNWYTTGTYASPTSFVGLLRAKTGIDDFDLPTEAQWQYLCRAGTTSYYSDGASASAAETNILNQLGWWAGNNGGNARHPVGEKAPNAWGLFDTHGNVWEFCLDWYVSSLGTLPATDPTGPVSGSARVACGGSGSLSASACRSACRGSCAPSAPDTAIGFRVVRSLK